MVHLNNKCEITIVNRTPELTVDVQCATDMCSVRLR